MSKRNFLILGIVVVIIAAVWYYNSVISGGVVKSPSSQCIDSDTGIEYQQYFEKGNVQYARQVINDTCQGDVLIEAYCKRTVTGRLNGAVMQYSCRDGCEDGTCIYGEIEKSAP